MILNTHETYINRCLQIGNNGLGTTRPNPMVGAVIVYKDRIIGEGFTDPYGSAHAEVNAVNSVVDKSLLKESTMYVTLEPCSHFGKTPPCSDLIIRCEIPRVVIGCVDDNPQVAGNGIKRLRDNGVEVMVGVLEDECKRHLKRFFSFHNKKRPYVILKWAETKDGFIAPGERDEQKPVWITNKYSRQLVHKWRAEEQAILVGTNTVREDNPSLTVRDWTGENPIRVVLNSKGKLDTHLSVFDSNAETIVVSKENIDINGNSVSEICNYLHGQNINSVIIEGGAQTLQSFIDQGIWDEARVFTGNVEFKTGVKAPRFSGNLISESNILEDTLRIYVKN